MSAGVDCVAIFITVYDPCKVETVDVVIRIILWSYFPKRDRETERQREREREREINRPVILMRDKTNINVTYNTEQRLRQGS